MRFNSVKLIALGVVVSVLAVACGSGPNGAPRNAASVDILANPSLKPWLDGTITKFNQAAIKTASGRQAYATVTYAEAGQAVGDLTGGSGLPAIWIPDDEVWTGVLAKKGQAGYSGNCVSLAQSPLVIAMWRPIAADLGWPGRSLGWLDVGSVAADPSTWAYYSGGKYGETLRLGHGHPGLTASGASTLLAVVQAARSKTEAVSLDDIKDPIVDASVAAFESTVAVFAQTTEQLGQTMHDRGSDYLGAGVMYESTLVNNGGGGDDGLVAIYPFEGTFVAKHPACINGGADAQTQEAAKLFRDYMLKPEAQKAAVAAGLRPVTSGVAVMAPIDAAHGADPAQPKVVFNSPSADTIFAVDDLWQASRKHVNMVMLVDISGSMKGDKIDAVRTASMQFVKQMGDDDYLTLITFSDKIKVLIQHEKLSVVRDAAVKQLGGIQAGGNTSLYDAIGTASDLIKKSNSSQTTNAMVLLTDGQDTSSGTWEMGQPLIDAAAANNTTVYTIAYGSDADKDVLSQLASQGKGNFYQGTEANIAGIYEEMSAAFGGSAGIGR